MKLFTIMGVLLLLLPFNSNAYEEQNKATITPSLYISFETGQIVKGRYKGETFSHLWLGNIIGRGGLKVAPRDWLTLLCDLEGRVWYNTWPASKKTDKKQILGSYYSFYLNQAQGIFSFLQDKPIRMEFALGMFPYKYNPEVRDLGEFLFRSGTYPVYLINNFDFPMARLTGFRAGFDFDLPWELAGNNFNIHCDLMLLTERDMLPYHDFSFASIVNVNAFNLIEVGGGLNFAHLWPVDEDITTPKSYLNIMNLDTISVDSTGWPTEIDTSYYTFKGTKMMFRTTIDPVFFLRGRDGFIGDFFGKHGLKFYGELAIIGLDDYPAFDQTNQFGYTDIKERMPKMLGVTIPCWKLLDIFALELEHFSCPYPNNYEFAKLDGLPVPFKVIPNTEYDSATYAEDNYKFAAYMKKSIGDNVSFIVQVSRDHQRWECNSGHWLNYDWEEIFVKWDQWSWHFKTEFKF